MAYSRSCLLFFSLTLVLFSNQTNARDSYSFNKFHGEEKDQKPNNLVPIQTKENNNEQDNQNPNFIPDSENGYGLYGHEKATYNNKDSNNYKNYEEDNVNYDEDSFSTPSLTQTQESYKNYPKTSEVYDKNDKGYGNNVERQGMSDTRFMANGNYYFDLDDDRNHGRFYKKHRYNYNHYHEKDSSFKNPYDSENKMSQEFEMFGEGQGDKFTP
ncbi:unnamed protein product [Cochlearia groenlandica]